MRLGFSFNDLGWLFIVFLKNQIFVLFHFDKLNLFVIMIMVMIMVIVIVIMIVIMIMVIVIVIV